MVRMLRKSVALAVSALLLAGAASAGKLKEEEGDANWSRYGRTYKDEEVRDAAASCPSEAISLVDADTGQPVNLDK